MKRFFLLTLAFLILSSQAFTQKKDVEEKDKDTPPWSSSTFSGLKFRSIGPAFYTGRIADIAIHPEDENVWYVAVGSGGVWKTVNAGVTFTPIFDSQKVFSIGCVTIDERNPNRVWVGSGENLGGRHFSWGDGIYLSEDGGAKWKNMGLKASEHISKIIIHPENSDVIWVASQGPLWSKGGERGVYKSSDGGETWKRTLGNDDWTGATDLLIDPRDPMRLYAATWDRHRTVAAYMGGGPGSGIHVSEDGGETWTALKSGLPSSNMGKIGLAISPQRPDVLYACIELDLKKGAVYRSENRGMSWKKMSDEVAGGTGPHYYNELWASPHAFDRIYFANNYLKVSNDGGKKFSKVKKNGKHVDNHAMAFKKDDDDYLLVGTDGGIYESYDLAETWRHFGNMPITQFYKIAVDDAEPFYNVYGGTQDNSTQGGASRTMSRSGIQNRDWQIINGGDGHQPATEPGNPNVVYAQSQEGYLNRIDMQTGERISVRPRPKQGEPYERWNWDAPILVSPHSPTRLYFASQRLWRSDDRGDSWTAISEDLTRNENRLSLPIMGKKQSYNNPWDVYAMSNFNSITSISESPVQEGRLYIGTDDGLLWRSDDNGSNWAKKEVGSISGVPARAFVNDVKADLFNANTAYVALDNHKEGDYRSMLYKTSDGGNTYTKITKGLPDSTLVWRIVQDHIDKNLLFLGTEFGMYFSVNGGGEWTQLKGGLPTISFRDLAIQRREDDLVCASFGRSIYILDDYSPLRNLRKADLDKEALLLPMRHGDLFQMRGTIGWSKQGTLGSDHYVADNPPYGAVITYYLKEGFESAKSIRKKKEKDLIKEKLDVPFPGYDVLEAERGEYTPSVWLTISDAEGKVLRRIESPAGKGMHRVAWDLETVSMRPLPEGAKGKEARPGGREVGPGTYTVSLIRLEEGELVALAGPLSFEVKRLQESSIPAGPESERIAFDKSVESAMANMGMQRMRYEKLKKEIATVREAIIRSDEQDIGTAMSQLRSLEDQLDSFDVKLNGEPSKKALGEKTDPSISTWMWAAASSSNGTYGPTPAGVENLGYAQAELMLLKEMLDAIVLGKERLVESIEGWVKPGY